MFSLPAGALPGAQVVGTYAGVPVPGRLQRITAARLTEGLEIRQSPYSLTVQFLTVVPFFKVCCPEKRA